MPGFVRSKKDESVWVKAKKATAKSKNKSEESFSDTDWALTNHIYHKMKKSNSLRGEVFSALSMLKSAEKFSIEEIKEALIKIRRNINEDDESEYDPYSDEEQDEYGEESEYDPYSEEDQDSDPYSDEDEDNEFENLREFDPDDDNPVGEDEEQEQQDDENDAASSWLRQQQKEKASAQQPSQQASKPTSRASLSTDKEQEQPTSKWYQPSKEELAELRSYTVPWERTASMRTALSAQPTKNPVIAHQGQLIASRELSHGDRQKAYNDFINSPEYKNASKIQKMKMDREFHKNWLDKNPDHTEQAVKAHGEAHKKGQAGRDAFDAVKEENIMNVIRGGAQAEAPMSMEEAMQHVGGVKQEDAGTVGAVAKDPAAVFAAANKSFIKDFASYYEKERANKAKKPLDENDMMNFDRRSEEDIKRILGPHGEIKDPTAKAKFDNFFKKYYPLIGINAKRVVNQLQMNKKDVDYGALDEAGMHGLIKAVNRYDHDHPKKASFATHASSLIRGEMKNAMSQLREQGSEIAVPAELRRAAKRVETVRRDAPPAAEQPKVPQSVPAPQSAPEAPKPENKSPQVLVRRHKDPTVSQRLQMVDSLKVKKPEGQE
jgi:hypothetical protein